MIAITDCGLNRFVTLLKSDFVLGSEQLASLTGAIHFDVPVGGYHGSVSATGSDVVNGHSQFHSASSLSWDISSDGSSAAIDVGSEVSLLAKSLFDVTGDVVYGDDKYSFNATDSTAEFKCWGVGSYGGDMNDW